MAGRGFTHESQQRASVEWYTPPHIFRALDCTFDMDVCSPGADVAPWIPAKRHLTLREDGLTSKWAGLVWMNPPYGRAVVRWVARFIRHNNGVALTFSRTDTEWFHCLLDAGAYLLFLRKRVRFLKNGVPQGCPGCGSVLIGLGAGKRVLSESLFGLPIVVPEGARE